MQLLSAVHQVTIVIFIKIIRFSHIVSVCAIFFLSTERQQSYSSCCATAKKNQQNMSWSGVKSINNCWKIKLHQKSDSHFMFCLLMVFFSSGFYSWVCVSASTCVYEHSFAVVFGKFVVYECVLLFSIIYKTVSLFILCSWRDFQTTATAYGNLFLLCCCQPDFFFAQRL